MAFIVEWDESVPQIGEEATLGASRITDFKYAIRERLEVEHNLYADETGHTDVGEHKPGETRVMYVGTKASFPSPTSTNSGAVAYASDEKKMYYWSGSAWTTVTLDISILTTNIMQTIYPVGSLYTSTLSTNPNTLLGFGTWTAFGEGKVMVGLNSLDSDFNASEKTGGEKTHALITAELPSHTHTYNGYGGSGLSMRSAAGDVYASSMDTGSTGSGTAHNNLQPYIVVYMWKRTA